MSELPEDFEGELEFKDLERSKAQRIGLMALIGSVVFSLILSVSLFSQPTIDLGILNDLNGYSANSDSSNSVDTSWVPTGYSIYGSEDVAYMWSPNSNCDTYTCATAKFVSKYGCSGGFYAAVNFLDSTNGNVIGFTNASLPSLLPMQIASLRFDDTSDSAKSAQISTINCY